MNKERIRSMRSDIGKPRKVMASKIFEDTEKVQNMPANRRWELRNKEKDIEDRKLIHYKYNLKKKFNMTHEEYEQMFYEQKGLCAVCKNPETSTRAGVIKRLAVDHNHITGKIRKLLCVRCNATLGQVNDNIEILQNMIDYLKGSEINDNEIRG